MTANSNELESYQNQLRELVAKLVERSGLPGASLDLLANGWRVQVAVGRLAVDSPLPIDVNSRFEIGTLCHLLFGLAIANLAAQGKVDLEAPIGTLLPELAASELGERVQLWHLLSSTGGYKSITFADPEVRYDYSWEKLVSYLRSAPLLFEPGSVFSYTPTAPALIAEIVLRITGTPAISYVRSCFLDSLGLNVGTYDSDAAQPEINVVSHGVDPTGKTFIRAARFKLGEFWRSSLSDFTLSLRDLNRLIEAIIEARNRTQPSETSPIHPRTAQILQEPVLEIPYCVGGMRSERLPRYVGVGCAEFAPDWVGYSGPFAGQSMCFRYHRKESISLAIGMNAHSPFLCEALANEVITSLTGEKPSLARSETQHVNIVAAELIGAYSGITGAADVSIKQNGNDIVCDFPMRKGTPPLRVMLQQDNRGNWVPRTDPGTNALGFFRDRSDTPCLMVGPIAYRKVT